jgi:hypothetical protein
VVLAVLAAISATACLGPKDSPSGTSTPRGAGAANWTDVTSWEGEGNGDSQKFHISTDVWRVLWNAESDQVGSGDFVVHIYNEDGTFFLNLFDSKEHGDNVRKGPLTGTLGVEGQGDFFLRIITTRSYDVTIQERR